MNHLGQKKSVGVKCSCEVKVFNLLMQTFCHTSKKQLCPNLQLHDTKKKTWGIPVLRQEECNSHSQGSATHEGKQEKNITNKVRGKRSEARQKGEVPLLSVTQ